jgi:hypothetical protein
MEVLLANADGRDQFNVRCLHLTLGSTIDIKRSSKSDLKNIVAASDNGFIDSPVVSRNHATISMDQIDGVRTDSKPVGVTD